MRNVIIPRWACKGAIKALPVDEQLRLYRLARGGDSKAKQILCDNVKLAVVKIAKSYAKRNDIDFADLFQAGMEGVNYAIDSGLYDCHNDSKSFNTYSVDWAHGKISRYVFNNYAQVRTNKYVKGQVFYYKAGLIKDIAETQNPSIKEAMIVDLIGRMAKHKITRQDIDKALEYREYASPLSFDQPIAQGFQLHDVIGNNDVEEQTTNELFRNDVKRHVSEVLDQLNPKDQYVLRSIFFEGKVLGDVSEKWGVSRERVRQKKVQALRNFAKKIKRNSAMKEILTHMYGDYHAQI